MKIDWGKIILLGLLILFWLALAGVDFVISFFGIIPGVGDAFVGLSSVLENTLQAGATAGIAVLSYMFGKRS